MSISIDNQTAQAYALDELARHLYYASITKTYKYVDAILEVINKQPYISPEQIAQRVIILQCEQDERILTEQTVANHLQYRTIATIEQKAKLFAQLVELVRLKEMSYKLASKLVWYAKSRSWDANGYMSDAEIKRNHKRAWRRLQSFVGGTLGSFLGQRQTSTPNALTLLQALSTRLHS